MQFINLKTTQIYTENNSKQSDAPFLLLTITNFIIIYFCNIFHFELLLQKFLVIKKGKELNRRRSGSRIMDSKSFNIWYIPPQKNKKSLLNFSTNLQLARNFLFMYCLSFSRQSKKISNKLKEKLTAMILFSAIKIRTVSKKANKSLCFSNKLLHTLLYRLNVKWSFMLTILSFSVSRDEQKVHLFWNAQR